MATSKQRKRRVAIFCSAVLLTLATGGAITAAVWNSPVASTSNQEASNSNQTITLVKTARISDLSRPVATQTFTGQLVGRYESTLAFRTGGKVITRRVEVGQLVKAGDVLYELETNDLELQLDTAVANEKAADAAVQQAQQEEKRLRELLSQNAISQSDYDSVRLLLDSSLAKQVAATKQTELAERQLGYSKLTADRDGVVVSYEVEAGQVITAGQSILELVSTDEVELNVRLPEQLASTSLIEYGTISFWTQPDKNFKVQLRELSPIADDAARMYQARYRLLDSVTVQREITKAG